MLMIAGITLKAYSIWLFKPGVIGLKMLILTREEQCLFILLIAFT